MRDYRYQQLADQIARDIEQGVRRPGEKLSSIRTLAIESKTSRTTVIMAYSQLEDRGLIESRPKSGFFVRSRKFAGNTPALPETSLPKLKPTIVSSSQVIMDLLENAASFDLLPSKTQAEGNAELRQCLSRAQRRQGYREQNYYDEPLGLHELRHQIATRIDHGGHPPSPHDILITHGCQHALLLALMATTRPGDIVAMESPGFYGSIQLLDSLGLRVVELPCSPVAGMDIEALRQAVRQWHLKALIVAPNFATPTGACMSDRNKQALLNECRSRGITIIEDDVYSDLYFGSHKPRSIYSFDDGNNVILCSSFSKTLSRDLRIGWMLPGKFRQKVTQLKVVTAIATGITQQRGAAMYLASGCYERFMKKRRRELADRAIQWQNAVRQQLGTVKCFSDPLGGLALWAELPEQIDTIKLYSAAREQGITITPGPLFSVQGRYRNYLRLSFSEALTAEREQALTRLEQLIRQQLDRSD